MNTENAAIQRQEQEVDRLQGEYNEAKQDMSLRDAVQLKVQLRAAEDKLAALRSSRVTA